MNSKTMRKVDGILRCFTHIEPRWTATELAAKLKAPVTTLHGILADMVEMDLLTLSPVSKEYSIGLRCLELNAYQALNSELNNIALGIMHGLVFGGEHIAAVGVVFNGWQYITSVVLPITYFSGGISTGPRLPAHLCAGGIAVLAHIPEENLARYLALEWSNIAPAPPLNRELLEQELEQVRSQGYILGRGFSWQEPSESMAAPIFGKRSQVLGALVISGPHGSFSADQQGGAREKLVLAANEISQRCGHLSPGSFI